VKVPFAKPLKGFDGAGVLEVVDDFDGDTYRAVYTVQFANIVYVLHAFEKKARKGITTPTSDIDLIKRRLNRAKEDHDQWQSTQIST
jgi:phage-related protein